ncbi:MAG TPA: CPBP family intramembrane metalloprotease, partial [Phycisphaerae bacterium]|nr:CPBP family intramembrane metalloprotease [Phycisphaerae bacterium]
PCPIRLDGASSLYRRPLTLYFALLAASAIAIIAYRLSPSSEAHVEVIASAAIAAVTAIWAVFSFSQVRPVLANPGRFWHYPLAIGLGIATWGLSSLAVFALTSLLDIETLVLSDSLLQAGYGWAMVMLIYCVQPAIAEELAFRGFILEDLSTLLGLRSAVVVSSLLFMVLHLAPVNFPHLLVVGLVLGILRVRTASLYPCVVMHFTHNLLVIIGEMGGW